MLITKYSLDGTVAISMQTADKKPFSIELRGGIIQYWPLGSANPNYYVSDTADDFAQRVQFWKTWLYSRLHKTYDEIVSEYVVTIKEQNK